MSDRQAVFFDEYHLDVKVIWHGYRIASVPVMARGACQTWGSLDDPPKHFTSITAQRVGRMRWNLVCTWGPISYSLCSSQGWGISARVHVHTPLLYLENGWTDCADIWHVASGQLVMRLPHVYGGVTMHVRTCTPHFYISGTAEPIALRFGI